MLSLFGYCLLTPVTWRLLCCFLQILYSVLVNYRPQCISQSVIYFEWEEENEVKLELVESQDQEGTF